MSAAPHPAVEQVRARALALLGPHDRYAFASDPDTFGHGKTKQSVLIGIATRHGSLVMAMDASDWMDPEELACTMMLEFVGCKPATAMEKAVEAKAALPKK